MKVKTINRSANPLPAYETIDSAGMDLPANIESPIELKLSRLIIRNLFSFINKMSLLMYSTAGTFGSSSHICPEEKMQDENTEKMAGRKFFKKFLIETYLRKTELTDGT